MALEAAEWVHERKRRKNKERRRKSDGKKRTERGHKAKRKSRTLDKKEKDGKEGKSKGTSRMVLETEEYTVSPFCFTAVSVSARDKIVHCDDVWVRIAGDKAGGGGSGSGATGHTGVCTLQVGSAPLRVVREGLQLP